MGAGWICITGETWQAIGLGDQPGFSEIKKTLLLPEECTVDAVDIRQNDTLRVYRVWVYGIPSLRSVEGMPTIKPIYRRDGDTVTLDHIDVFGDRQYTHFPTDASDVPDFYTTTEIK